MGRAGSALQKTPRSSYSLSNNFRHKKRKILRHPAYLCAAARGRRFERIVAPSVMVQRSKTFSRPQTASAGERATNHTGGARACDAAADSPQGLNAEVVSLLNEQAFTQGEACTEQDVCESFTEILLRHWDLCSVSTFLRGDEGGGLVHCTSRTHAHLDGEAARALGEAAAAEVARTGEEFGVGLEADARDAGTAEGVGELVTRAGLGACAAVPISAGGALEGVLVAA